MDLLLEIIKIEDILEICIIFFFSFIGSFAKDYLKMIRLSKRVYFNFIEIILSTCTASVITYALSIHIQQYAGTRGLVFVSFVIGLLGFELLIRLSSINGVITLITTLIDLYRHNEINQKQKRVNEKKVKPEQTLRD